MIRSRNSRSGQALVMMALCMAAMFSFLALSVDLGLAYFIRKSAQAAADAAALAGARQALRVLGKTGTYGSCPPGVTCQAQTPCSSSPAAPPATNTDNACIYAAQNGFVTGGNGGLQTVTVASDTTTPPPFAPGVDSKYWLTMEISEKLPQIFGGILNNPFVFVKARSVAAIVQTVVSGSALLLNRSLDCPAGANTNCGVDLLLQGQASLTASSGIWLASTRDGTAQGGGAGQWAAENKGNGTVNAPFVYIRGGGSYKGGTWNPAPTSGRSDGSGFEDPMRGLGQPAPPAGLPAVPVLGGLITGGTQATPLQLTPGNYYAAINDPVLGVIASGQPIRITGSVQFTSGSAGFADYVFFGGVTHQGTAGVATFAPGRYIFAGVQQTNGQAGTLFNTSNFSLQDSSSAGIVNSDAGEIFVFTDTNYAGLQVPAALQNVASQLRHGIAGFVQDPSSNAGSVNLHGLNPASSDLPAALKPFAPVVVWQDQRNSSVKYSASGYLDAGCSDPEVCQKTGGQIAADNTSNDAMELFLSASGQASLVGVVYQPRGAHITMNGNANFSGPLQLVGGSLSLKGVSLTLQGPARALRSTTVALVQ